MKIKTSLLRPIGLFSLIIATNCLLSACSNVEQAAHDYRGYFDPPPSQQRIYLNNNIDPTQWKQVDGQNLPSHGFSTSCTPTDQNLYNWKEMISKYHYPNSPENSALNALAVYQGQLAGDQQSCKKVQPQILMQNAQVITYRFDLTGCPSTPSNQVAVGKAFNGTDGVYFVMYYADPDKVPPAQIEKGQTMIQSSLLGPNPAYQTAPKS